jgi:hypothetical protein
MNNPRYRGHRNQISHEKKLITWLLHNKKMTPPQGGTWARLESPGDVRHYMRWLILQTKVDKVDVRKASVMGQLGLYLLKAMETT